MATTPRRARLVDTYCCFGVLFIILLQCCPTAGFSVDLRRRLPGIWKLTIQSKDGSTSMGGGTIVDQLFFRAPTSRTSSETGNFVNDENVRGLTDDDVALPQPQKERETGILLKLQDDGSFRQCDEGYQEGKWTMGRWELANEASPQCKDTILFLALDRQYFGPPHDTLLSGTFVHSSSSFKQAPGATDEMSRDENELDIDDASSGNTIDAPLQLIGTMETGKFMYPKKHPSFFDPPVLTRQEKAGEFRLEQMLSFFKIMPPMLDTDTDDNNQTTYKMSDFYQRKFFMTVVPAKSFVTERKWDDDRRQHVDVTENQAVDIRTMSVEFYANNTFQAKATNKILRGRFETEAGGKKLFFQVSMFGAGRSLKGSVYSEGPGLTHDDKRSYLGTIQPEEGHSDRLLVQGIVTFGTDVRPTKVGSFQLREVNDTSLDLDDFDEDYDEDDFSTGSGDRLDSVFE